MMNKIILFFLCFTTGIFAQNKMSTSEISNLKKQVKKVANKTTSIKSNFTQYKHLDFLSEDIITYGKLIYKAPSSVKWEYTKPYVYSVIFKDNMLKINDDGKKSNINLSGNGLFKKMNQLIVKSINGNMFDDNLFIINYSKSKDSYIINFKTKEAELKDVIAEFVLYFDKTTFEVSTVKMIEPSGDYTKIVFKNRITNQPVNNAVFSN